MRTTTAVLCALLVAMTAGAAGAAGPTAESIFEKRLMIATWAAEDQELTEAMTTVLSKGFGGRIFDMALDVASGLPKGTTEIKRQNDRAAEWAKSFPHESPYEFVSFQVVTNDYYVGKTFAYLVGSLRLRNERTGVVAQKYLKLTIRPQTNEVIDWSETKP